MNGNDLAPREAGAKPVDEAREVLSVLRRCRSRLNNLDLHHAAAYADIAVQLLKQSIATLEQGDQEP